jgi:uncharacterized protein YcbX
VSATRTSEPIRTLAKYRRQPGGIGGGIVSGSYFRPLGPGILRLGDEVTVLEQQNQDRLTRIRLSVNSRAY